VAWSELWPAGWWNAITTGHSIFHPEGQAAHGSARSVEGLNITAAIAEQKDLLLNFGGHPMAAGLSLDTEKVGRIPPAFIQDRE